MGDWSALTSRKGEFDGDVVVICSKSSAWVTRRNREVVNFTWYRVKKIPNLPILRINHEFKGIMVNMLSMGSLQRSSILLVDVGGSIVQLIMIVQTQ